MYGVGDLKVRLINYVMTNGACVVGSAIRKEYGFYKHTINHILTGGKVAGLLLAVAASFITTHRCFEDGMHCIFTLLIETRATF